MMKKKNLFTLLLLTVFFHAKSQSVQWDSTYRPNNYMVQVQQFRSYANAPTDFIFLGNSITAGTDWNELLNLPNARNRGISGDITFGVLERLQEVTEGKPAKVFILIGINDIAKNIPDAVILNNYKNIIQGIRSASPQTKIYFQTLLPVNNTFSPKNHYNKDEHILFINAELKKLAAAENITLIDLHPSFLNAENKLEKSYTMDGLHLNIAGYKVWASLLAPYLKD